MGTQRVYLNLQGVFFAYLWLQEQLVNTTWSYHHIIDVTDPADTEEHYHSHGVVFLSILPIKWFGVIHSLLLRQVARIKRWQLTILQTTDTFTFVSVTRRLP